MVKTEKFESLINPKFVDVTTVNQTSANTSTWYCYLSKICRFANYSCMNQ